MKMRFIKINTYLVTIFLVLKSCSLDRHFVLRVDHKNGQTETLLPPRSTYKVRITANGNIKCDTRIKLLMDGKETNFISNDSLKINNANRLLYFGDWYQNSLTLKLENPSCFSKDFEFIVVFYD